MNSWWLCVTPTVVSEIVLARPTHGLEKWLQRADKPRENVTEFGENAFDSNGARQHVQVIGFVPIFGGWPALRPTVKQQLKSLDAGLSDWRRRDAKVANILA